MATRIVISRSRYPSDGEGQELEAENRPSPEEFEDDPARNPPDDTLKDIKGG